MAAPPIHELTDRARDVFRIVVESYIDNGAPVGSRTISKISGLNLSPASIRNVMQDLEEFGLLAAPHTSAGRMPTESGLRLFVDGMMQASAPSAEERAAIEARARRGRAGRGRRSPRRRWRCRGFRPAPGWCWCPSASRCCASSASCR